MISFAHKALARLEIAAVGIKMSPEHYAVIKAKVKALGAEMINQHKEKLKDDPRVKDLETRLLFDVFYATKVQNDYSYQEFDYKDAHIKTAMKQIFKELHLPTT